MITLFIGDIIGSPGRAVTQKLLPGLKQKYAPDLIIANGENATHGNGLNRATYEELTGKMEIDVLTSGNHIWDKKEIFRDLASLTKLVRPANYPPGTPGQEKVIVECNGEKVGIINLLGRVFMPTYDDPFRAADRLVAELQKQGVKQIIVDIHAEATSEKAALAWYLDGRVSAVIGTHTHVQTADERLMPQGTAFITDAGQTGAYNSIIGVQKAPVLKRFLTMMYESFEPESSGPMQFNGVVIETDFRGKAKSIQRIYEVVN
ncbi:MAG: TIGR00282 family metallophosphoesterase [Candidatus Margulisiibacteriota bacterium]|jgi:hypothetical protein